MVQLSFEKAVGLLECLDLKGLTGDDLFRSFEAMTEAENAPTTKFLIV